MKKDFDNPPSRQKWLEWRGGRTEADVLDDNDGKGEYIVMSGGRDKEMKMYLPTKFQNI